ncbi:hypothetical protein [Actinomadura sp. 9N407]|uniref:hypothetical protein n=1 Tax=Actinomadura sp. 9N407 TaxID=3375154 RepID=UPI0037AEB8A8
MNSSSAMFVALALVVTGLTGVAFARWQRALADLRRTAAAIPGMRRTTFQLFVRMGVFALLLAGTLWWLLQSGS